MKRFGLVVLVLCLAGPLHAQAPPRNVTTLEDQTDVHVTAYNQDLGLVRDVRTLRLPTGELELEFQEVAERIQAQTVSLRSLSEDGSVTIYEQNYEFDLISPEKLMEKYIGQQVRLVNFSTEIGFEEVTATLLSTQGGAVYQVGDEIYIGHPGHVVLPRIPENLIARPTLIWSLGNAVEEQEIEVSYLTGGMSWQADYVITIPQDESAFDLKGWITLNNQSGATYNNARLKLIAGELHRAHEPKMDMMRMERAMAVAAPAPMPEQEAIGDYHMYTMPRRTTLRQNQSKQLALLDTTGIEYTKKYEFRGQHFWFYQPTATLRDQHVEVSMEFMNTEDNALGMPLPAGVMRIYQEDSEQALQFAGEDRIQHTPRNERVTLKVGKAFDVLADRVQTNFARIADNVYESSYEITVRNRKTVDVTVDIIEPMPGDWTITQQSMEHQKKDARTAVFELNVPADSEATVTYTVRVRS